MICERNSSFPPLDDSPGDRPLAVGGDLSIARLLDAYQNGIFPWYSENEPILWWSPDPRFVLFPEEIRVARSMRKYFKQDIFNITFDKKFSEVIKACQKVPRKATGTWIVNEMLEAFCALHEKGYAHSVEVWQGKNLVGGLYGVSIGRSFFGESMYSKKPNASKFALIYLARVLLKNKFAIIDCQVYTDHLASLGARSIPRIQFLEILQQSFFFPTVQGNWQEILIK